MLTTTASYLAVTNNFAKQQTATAATPEVKAATNYYLANIGKVKSVSDFVNNYQLFSYAMKAYGLEDMNYAKGLITKVIQGGTSSSTALANTLADPRYVAVAKAFSFLTTTPPGTPPAAATTGTTSKYVTQTIDDTQGQTNPGVQRALYFQQNAPSVTSSYGILADKTLLQVVETAFGIQFGASTDIDAEARTLDKLVPTTDLQNPAKLQQIIERYTANYDLNGGGSSSATSSVNQLFGASTPTYGVGSDLLLSLQSLPLGGA